MAEGEADAVALLEPVGELVEFGGRDVGDGTARLTHRGDRALSHPPVRGRTVTEMDVFDDADFLEVRQRPVHRGLVDVGVAFGQLLGRHPPAVGVQVPEQFEPGSRDPTATLAHALDGVVERDARSVTGVWRGHGFRVDAAAAPNRASRQVVHEPVPTRLEQQPGSVDGEASGTEERFTAAVVEILQDERLAVERPQ